jgi:hypothetical protein
MSAVCLRIHGYKRVVLGDSRGTSLGGPRDFPVAHINVVLILPATVCATQSLLCSPLRLFPNPLLRPPPWSRPPPPLYPSPPTTALAIAAYEAEPHRSCPCTAFLFHFFPFIYFVTTSVLSSSTIELAFTDVCPSVLLLAPVGPDPSTCTAFFGWHCCSFLSQIW